MFYNKYLACDAVNKIRIEVQHELPKKERIYFKHSRKLLLSRACKLKTNEQKDKLTYILINYSEKLRIAYKEKEELLEILFTLNNNLKLKYHVLVLGLNVTWNLI